MTKTTTEFINDSILTHGEKYDYSLVEYKNAHSKVIIICPKHGEFTQRASAHTYGQGCSKCYNNKTLNKLDTAEFIKRAETIHNHKYDYSLVDYIHDSGKIIVICPTHGKFTTQPGSHVRQKHGCKKCAGNETGTTQKFLENARKTHGDIYDYSLVDYINANTKVKIICTIHGEFEQKPLSHIILKNGCPKCGVVSMQNKLKKNQDNFILESKEIHGDKYDYSLVNYTARHRMINIICKEHGQFYQKASEHIRGYGCSKCAKNEKLIKEEFINRCILKHNNKFDYSNIYYDSLKSNIILNCKTHGNFNIKAKNHMAGGGCVKCAISTDQYILQSFIESLSVNYSINNRSIIKPYEIDIYIPEYNFGIEYNGSYWHSYNSQETPEEINKHSLKHKICYDNNIKLLQINTYELEHKLAIIKSMISHKINQSIKLYARKCDVKIISSDMSSKFFNNNHISGNRYASVNIGLTYEDELVSCINFINHGKNWEIIRFANKLNVAVVGGFSKLLKHFIRQLDPKQIITFSDNRYGNGAVYTKNGFELINTTKPGYIYLNKDCTMAGSRIKFQKHKLVNILEYFNPLLSESQNMFINGYRRMWDAGHKKHVLNV